MGLLDRFRRRPQPHADLEPVRQALMVATQWVQAAIGVATNRLPEGGERDDLLKYCKSAEDRIIEANNLVDAALREALQ